MLPNYSFVQKLAVILFFLVQKTCLNGKTFFYGKKEHFYGVYWAWIFNILLLNTNNSEYDQ